MQVSPTNQMSPTSEVNPILINGLCDNRCPKLLNVCYI